MILTISSIINITITNIFILYYFYNYYYNK